MSDSYSLSSHSDDEGVEVTSDIRIVQPKQGCRDEVRTLLVGRGKGAGAADQVYTGTDAYLGFYGHEVVEAYVKVGRKGSRIHCGRSSWATISRRLTLTGRFQGLDWPALEATVRAGTGAEAPSREKPDQASTSSVSPTCARAQSKDRPGNVQGQQQEKERRAQGPENRVIGSGELVFQLQFTDIIKIVLFGVFLAYLPMFLALLLFSTYLSK